MLNGLPEFGEDNRDQFPVMWETTQAKIGYEQFNKVAIETEFIDMSDFYSDERFWEVCGC